jgi:hypothetical protein
MSDNILNVLKTLVAEFFKEEWYHVGISNLRESIFKEPFYKDNWTNLIKIILLKQIPYGEALNILFEDGHQILHENTEEEAYRWFTLMIINVSKNDNESILDYQKFLSRDYDTSS